MRKKITSISINNFKGYFREYEPIKLSNGENLLIYGENGSGKSSFYKALNTFFSSSRDASVKYIKNRYLQYEPGKLEISFSDYDNDAKQILVGTEMSFSFSDTISNHGVLFIQNAALTKGFLDYTDLLKVYFHNEPEPNLFDLIILNLLGDHIPLVTGGNFRFKERWENLQKDLINNAYTRNDRCHKNAIDFLPIYETHLRGTLDEIFLILNDYLSKYFEDLNIIINYKLSPIQFNYGNNKSDWKTRNILKLHVTKDGISIDDGYNDFLNEARLSAIAISLYLASLRTNPSSIDFKILFLDDVFIGLDSGNRIPILNILKNEFPDFQKFISTYDRHWFELAKKYFQQNVSDAWNAVEMYVGYDFDPITNNQINKPIVVDSNSYYEKAIRFLNHRSVPDFPAAANYFRKALEQLFEQFIPKWFTSDSDFTQIPGFQLSLLITRTKHFLSIFDNSTEYIDRIYSLLFSLLHPLSHHEISSPLYRGELIIIQKSYENLKKQLIDLGIPQNFKCCLESGKRIKITFVIDNKSNHYCFYELILKDSLALRRDASPIPFISKANCFVAKCYGHNGDIPYPTYNPKKKDINFSYNSLINAYERIHDFLESKHGVFPKADNYLEMIEFYDGTKWQPFVNKLVW